MELLAVLALTLASCNLLQVAEMLFVPCVLESADLRVLLPPHRFPSLPETLAEETLYINGLLIRSNE